MRFISMTNDSHPLSLLINSDFNDIFQSLVELDADMISVENSKSDGECSTNGNGQGRTSIGTFSLRIVADSLPSSFFLLSRLPLQPSFYVSSRPTSTPTRLDLESSISTPPVYQTPRRWSNVLRRCLLTLTLNSSGSTQIVDLRPELGQKPRLN